MAAVSQIPPTNPWQMVGTSSPVQMQLQEEKVQSTVEPREALCVANLETCGHAFMAAAQTTARTGGLDLAVALLVSGCTAAAALLCCAKEAAAAQVEMAQERAEAAAVRVETAKAREEAAGRTWLGMKG